MKNTCITGSHIVTPDRVMSTSLLVQAMGLKNRKGVLILGTDVNLAVLTHSDQVCMTMAAGWIIYQDACPQGLL
jgi:N-acetylglucosamine-6-phosphate deacetylase